jgi:hypothetical protein
MAPPTWATPGQQEFLMSKQADYFAAKQEGANVLRNWKTECYRLFFQRWPSQDAETNEIAQSSDPLVRSIVPLPFKSLEDWAVDHRKVRLHYFLERVLNAGSIENQGMV